MKFVQLIRARGDVAGDHDDSERDRRNSLEEEPLMSESLNLVDRIRGLLTHELVNQMASAILSQANTSVC